VLQLYRISPLGMVGSFATGILQGAVFGMGAVYANKAGLSISAVSVFMFVLIAGAAVLQWPIGKLSDRIDRRWMITGLAIFGATASLVAIVATRAWPRALMGLAAPIGAGPMLLYSLFIAYTNDHLRPEQMVAASSSLILIFGVGAILGPTGAGWLMGMMGPTGFLWLLGIAQSGIAAFAAYRMCVRPSGSIEAQSPYSANPARTAALSPALAEQVTEAWETPDAAVHGDEIAARTEPTDRD